MGRENQKAKIKNEKAKKQSQFLGSGTFAL
jgi:hypothetical protein